MNEKMITMKLSEYEQMIEKIKRLEDEKDIEYIDSHVSSLFSINYTYRNEIITKKDALKKIKNKHLKQLNEKDDKIEILKKQLDEKHDKIKWLVKKKIDLQEDIEKLKNQPKTLLELFKGLLK